MSSVQTDLLKRLSDSVVNMDEDITIEISNEAVQSGVDAYEAIDQGLANGMDRAGKLFEEEEYFIPELLLCADAMYSGLDILKPHLKIQEGKVKTKVVIGVMEGDTHDIGKNLVRIMLETSGFEVLDLGRDVAPSKFVEKAKEINAEIIALSTLMTTTMDGMAQVVNILKKQGIRENFKVIIGGGPISVAFADKIGADGYSKNAAEAVRLAQRLVGLAVKA